MGKKWYKYQPPRGLGEVENSLFCGALTWQLPPGLQILKGKQGQGGSREATQRVWRYWEEFPDSSGIPQGTSGPCSFFRVKQDYCATQSKIMGKIYPKFLRSEKILEM